MRTTAIVLAVIMLASVLPSVGARHLSAGFEDTVATGVEETPEDPTVPQEAYERGLQIEDCYESEGELSADAAMEATQGDAFCGELVYHGGSSLEQTSPPDQQFLAEEIEEFDVYVSNYMGSSIERWNQPFVDPVWEGIHGVGEELEMTDSAQEADENDGDRTQAYHVALHYPFATDMVQRETGAWEMNGPYSMEPRQAFVGFLYDDEGDPIGDDDLERMIEQKPIASSAIPAICGFQPFGSFAAINNIGSCGIELTYIDNSGSQEDEFREYEDECKSPVYVCNPTAGGAWHGRIQCSAPCGSNSEFSYERWHWVAAPILEQECDARAPGFALDPKAGKELPYLAHDLDVYSPTASAVDEVAFPTTWNWANDAAGNALEPVDEAIDTLPDLPGLPDLPDTSGAMALIEKDARVEPNAHPAGDVADTSQSLAEDPSLQRSITECQALTSSEDPDTVDPWVDIVDGQTNAGTTAQRSGSGLENFVGLDMAGFGSGQNGAYLTSEEHQDSSNRPGPATVWTEGKVGMFTDKNDDGDYDQEFLGSKYQLDEIDETGAYPMLWDMWVGDDGEPDPTQGCTVVGGDTHTEMMVDAGYGPNTGLAQLVYLAEPTAFVEPVTGEVLPYPEGNNIYVLASNSVKETWTPGTQAGASDLAAAIDDAVADLAAYVEANNGDAGTPDVRMPGDELGRDIDFQGQCNEPTGGFTSALSFAHDCTVDCSADTIATVYTFEVTNDDGSLGGGETLGTIPAFTTQQTDPDPYSFGTGVHTWIDVDPFDGDPDRNTEGSSAPPT